MWLHLWHFSLLLLLGPAGGLSGAPCWEALLRCQDEPDCGSAYSQSWAACQPVLGREEPACPSHCVAALVRLNRSRSGPALERCECGGGLKAALEPCLPLPLSSRGGRGCTSARARCQLLPACRAPLAAYLARCGQLFNGRRCSGACRAAVGHLLAAPGGPALERCVCDGTERSVCQLLKARTGRLCFGPQQQQDHHEDYPDEEEEEEEEEGQPGLPGGGSCMSSAWGTAWHNLALAGILPLGLLWLFCC